MPPRKPESLRILADVPTLTAIVQTTQLRVLATFADGTSEDVSPRSRWTSYRISNPSIASISNDGLVAALDRGMVSITAVNEGTTTVEQVDISPGDPLTEICGFVHDTNGLPVPGLTVKVVGATGTTISGVDGTFRIPGVATSFGIQGVIAYGTNGGTVFGVARNLRILPGGITDAGIIIAETLCTTCPDVDGDRLPDSLESLVGTDPGRRDTDADGLSDYDEVFLVGTDPRVRDTDGNGIPDGLEDPDFDTLTNTPEATLGTNPFLADTDGDGWDDATEIADGTDPLDPASGAKVSASSRLLSFFNGSEEIPPANILWSVASATLAYFNGLEERAPTNTLWSVSSGTLSYFNGTVEQPPTNTPWSVASLTVSYFNGLLEQAPTSTLWSVHSSTVSYFNGQSEQPPTSTLWSAASSTLSYFNGALEAASTNVFIVSPVVSYENQ